MKKSKNNGITLVALIVTIIILLILSGIAISNLLGENGLINQAKLGKEKYAISEAKEKIELEITNLQIEQQSKGEALTKEILPKINNEDIDVGDTSNFPVEVICGKYKFEVDNVFQVKYIGEADDTVIKYTTEPDDYTNQSNVKVLLKISNPKGIKSIHSFPEVTTTHSFPNLSIQYHMLALCQPLQVWPTPYQKVITMRMLLQLHGIFLM